MRTRGFTIIELIITITIMGILLTLAAVGLATTQVKARDDERRTDVEAIKTNLESFYTSGATESSLTPSVVNYVNNPSFETNTTSWASTSGCGSPTSSRNTTQFFSGIASLQLNTTAIDQCVYLASPYIVTTSGRTYTMSAWVKGSGSAQLTLSSHPSGTVLGSSSTVTLSTTWQRLTVTATTGGSTIDVYPVIWQRTSGAQTMYIDAVMATETSYLTNYADGGTSGWSWLGTVNNSTSTGPAVPTGTPGTYPSVSLIGTLRANYLPNADSKIFTAPGGADALIIATNSTQTTSGILPQPTTSQYVYQPIDSNGALCMSNDCRKFNIYYRLEGDNTVYMVRSKNQ